MLARKPLSTEEFLEFIHKRILRELLDIVILGMLNKSRFPMSGYDVISFVHKKFGVLISSGTVYGLIHRMEREGLMRGFWKGRKRVYTLTEKGKETIKALLDERNEIINLIEKLLRKD
ncbi:MAG: PadR family transcriptional regulator [Candidatus Bathyarchaeia archaeon]